MGWESLRREKGLPVRIVANDCRLFTCQHLVPRCSCNGLAGPHIHESEYKELPSTHKPSLVLFLLSELHARTLGSVNALYWLRGHARDHDFGGAHPP